MTTMKILAAALVLTITCSAEWKTIPVPTEASFRGLSAVSGDVVWASGTAGTLIRTVDAGKTWSVIQVPEAEKLDFRGARAFDEDIALIMSSGKAEEGQARIYRTRDAGKSWNLVFEDKTPGVFFDAIAFWDRDHGIVLSDPVGGHFVLFTTDDGGTTWSRVPSQGLPPALPGEGAFAASNSCLVVGGASEVWFGTGGASVARVFHSGDRGRTWSVAETPMRPANPSSGIFSLAFYDSLRGIAVGGDYANPKSFAGPNVLLTSDGGKTWKPGGATEPAGLYLSAVVISPNSTTVWAVGRAGITVGEKGVAWSSKGTENLNAVTFPSSTVGWAVGPEGRVERWQPGKAPRLR